MKIAYLMNTYPMVSTTFIGREIAGLEQAGFQVSRFVIRRWTGTLVDPADIAESERSDHLLEDGAMRLILGFCKEVVQNPMGVRKAARQCWQLWRNGGGVVRHVAYLLEAAALRQRVRRDPVQHIHAHFSTNAAAVAMMTHALGGPTYSFTVHGPDELFEPQHSSLGLKIENAAFVACISHFCRSQCMIFAPVSAWDRLKIVHCGVRLADYAAPVTPIDLPARTGTGGRIVYVARLSQLKGGLGLMDAMKTLEARHPEADLLVVGDGEMRAPMTQRAAALGIKDRVHFLGFRSREDVRAAMAASDVLTLPSFAEGVPVVLMEAMAGHRPVVASQVAGVSELVEHGVSGYVVPPGDSDTLAESFARLLDDPDLRAKMGKLGHAKVAAEFDIDAETAWLGDLITTAAQGTPLPVALRPTVDHA